MSLTFVRPQIIKEIADQIWESEKPHLDLSDQCDSLLQSLLPAASALEICDVLEDVIVKVAAQLRRRIAQCREKSITPRYEFSEISSLLYRVKDVGIDKIKSKIKCVSWKDFQALCSDILKSTGISLTGMTKWAKEGGIDFYGVLDMRQFSDRILIGDLKIRIIGQAKHRSTGNKIGEPEIELFAQHISNFELGKGRGLKAVPQEFVDLKAPTIGLFITNSDFAGGVRGVARERGILVKDGDQIAEDIFHSPSLATKWLSD